MTPRERAKWTANHFNLPMFVHADGTVSNVAITGKAVVETVIPTVKKPKGVDGSHGLGDGVRVVRESAGS